MLVVSYVISPIHVIATLAACRALYATRGDVRCLLVFSYPGAPEESRNRVASVMRAMVASVPEVIGIVELEDEWINTLDQDPAQDKVAAEVHRRLGTNHADALLYAHDMIGRLFQVLVRSYPDCETVCFGDALGMVYEAHVHLGFIKSPTQPIASDRPSTMHRIKRRVRMLRDRFAQKNLPPTLDDIGAEKSATAEPATPKRSVTWKPRRAALAVPIDQSGHFLDDVPLEVVGKHYIQSALRDCAASASDFSNYLRNLLTDSDGGPRCLLLTENNAEAGFIDFDRETQMYVRMVRGAVGPGATVILKSHPGEWLPRNDAIAKQLGSEYRVITFDPRFARYPIELAEQLVRKCTVVCMSFPTLSLSYLYDVDVINPMDDPFVEEWFPEHLWDSYKNAQSLYRIPLARLATWDGTSPLYSGG